MSKIYLSCLMSVFLYNCGQRTPVPNTQTETHALVKDTEAWGLISKVKSLTSVTWRSPSDNMLDMSFDELYSKAQEHIALNKTNVSEYTKLTDSEIVRRSIASTENDSFDINGNTLYCSLNTYFDLYSSSFNYSILNDKESVSITKNGTKSSSKLTRKSVDTFLTYDTDIFGTKSIVYSCIVILDDNRQISQKLSEAYSDIHDMSTKLFIKRTNLARSDSLIIWADETVYQNSKTSDTITYKVLKHDAQGNPLKLLSNHSDKSQQTELILYKYTYYE